VKKTSILLLIVILTAFCAISAGCSATMGDKLGGDPIGTVNGEDIYSGEYDLYYNQSLNYMTQMGLDTTSADAASVLSYIEQEAWNSCVSNEILRQAAKENDIEVSDSDLEKIFNDEIKSNFATTDEYNSWLESSGLNETQILELLRVNQLNTLLYDKVTEDIGVSEEAALKEYNAAPAKWNSVKVSHILITADMTNGTAEEIAAAKAKAEDVIARLDKGEDFATLAKELSDDTSSAENGGALDYLFNIGDTNLVEEFVKASFELKNVGDYTKTPVKTDYGFHIIKLDEKANTFDALKQSIIDELSAPDKETAFNEYMSGKENAAVVTCTKTFTYWTDGNNQSGATSGTADNTATTTK